MSIGAVGDNIRNAANSLPVEQLDTAYDEVGEALNTAWELLEGHTAKDAEDALKGLSTAMTLIEEVQRMFPGMRNKMYAIADRLGTITGGSIAAPFLSDVAGGSRPTSAELVPQLPLLSQGFVPYDFSRQKKWGRQVLQEATKVFGDRNIEEVEAEIVGLPDKFKLEKDGRAVGFLGGTLAPNGRYGTAGITYSIHFMTILPGERGGMYALEMLAEAERRARAAGAVAVEFLASNAIKRVCGRWGYVEDPEVEGQSTNSMRKVL